MKILLNLPQAVLSLFLSTSILWTAGFGILPVNPEPDPSPSSAPRGAAPTRLVIRVRNRGLLGLLGKPDPQTTVSAIQAQTHQPAALVRVSGDRQIIRFDHPLNDDELSAVLAETRAIDGVASVDLDLLASPNLVPDDNYYSYYQWDMQSEYGINLEPALDLTTGDLGIPVAVIDTGYTEHPDLEGRVIGGYDFVSDACMGGDDDGWDPDAHDEGDYLAPGECDYYGDFEASSWHGTHVSGTIGAKGNDGNGVAGVTWRNPLIEVRVLGKGGGYFTDIVDGMLWAAGLPVAGVPLNQHPARVLSLSLGGSSSCPWYVQDAIDQVNQAGAVVVVAAGNNGVDASNTTPANCAGVVVVGATDSGGARASYSNYGAIVTLSAPGSEILSTYNLGETTPADPGYAFMYGTSMATPHVSGMVALMLSVNPGLHSTEVIDILKNTARPFESGACGVSSCGAGIADAAAAVQMAMGYVIEPGVGAPSIEEITPSSGYINRVNTLQIDGANFSAKDRVWIDNTTYKVTVQNSSQISVDLPANYLKAGSHSVQICNSSIWDCSYPYENGFTGLPSDDSSVKVFLPLTIR